MEDLKWKPPFTKWYNVKKETYQLIYENAKERLEDVLSESESITTKSIKMITALAAFLGFFIRLVIDKNWSLGYMFVFIIIFLIDAMLLFILIAPKYVKWRGLSPKVLIPKELDNEEDKEYQEQIIFYSRIVIIQDNIDTMLDRNKNRASLYKWALLLFLILFTTTASFIASII